MVFYNEDDDKKVGMFECSCGTHGVKVERIKGETEMFISFYTDDFYGSNNSKFFSKVWKRLKILWRVIRGKDYLLQEVCINENDSQDIIDIIEKVRKVDASEF